MQLNETKDGWLVSLTEGRLGFIHIDFRLTLDFNDSAGVISLTTETQCHLKRINVDTILSPEEAGSLAPILPLFNAGVDRLVIRNTGNVKVEFANGDSLEIGPDQKHEAWQIACSIGQGFLMVCAPGGMVSLFRDGVGRNSK